DEAGSHHDAEDEPAVEPEDLNGRWPLREGTRIDEGAEKDGEETRLEELDLPSERVPLLPDVDERHVERPQHQHERRIREADDDDEGKDDARPCETDEQRIRVPEPEDAREV